MCHRHTLFRVVGGVITLNIVLWLALVALLASEHVVGVTLPLVEHRWLIADLSYHRLSSVADEPYEPQVFRELRVRAGTDNTLTDTYQQLLDLTIPIWPLALGSDS